MNQYSLLKNSYGYPNPIQPNFINPVISKRSPISSDWKYPLGTIWISKNAGVFYLIEVENNTATWILSNLTSQYFTDILLDSGAVNPASGYIELEGKDYLQWTKTDSSTVTLGLTNSFHGVTTTNITTNQLIATIPNLPDGCTVITFTIVAFDTVAGGAFGYLSQTMFSTVNGVSTNITANNIGGYSSGGLDSAGFTLSATGNTVNIYVQGATTNATNWIISGTYITAS